MQKACPGITSYHRKVTFLSSSIFLHTLGYVREAWGSPGGSWKCSKDSLARGHTWRTAGHRVSKCDLALDPGVQTLAMAATMATECHVQGGDK